MTEPGPDQRSLAGGGSRATQWLLVHYPGLLITILGGFSAEAASLHYGAPTMLMALLIGLAIHFVYDLETVRPGIEWVARVILRYGVALLGVKIAIVDMLAVGVYPLLLVLLAMGVTMAVAMVGARVLGLSRVFAALSGGSVAVCGASAAVAISCVLRENDENERSLAVVISVVTVMATIAMIVYPLLLLSTDLAPRDMGVILGGTIHDVAQVAAAGKTISAEVGEVAIFVKLMRVALLLPIVGFVFLWLGNRSRGAKNFGGRVQFVPAFLIAFFVLAVCNSVGLLGEAARNAGADVSHYFLVFAITAIGVKTDLRAVLSVGWRPVALIVVETLVMFAIVLGGVVAMH